jgi:hypothetical protein
VHGHTKALRLSVTFKPVYLLLKVLEFAFFILDLIYDLLNLGFGFQAIRVKLRLLIETFLGCSVEIITVSLRKLALDSLYLIPHHGVLLLELSQGFH